jgi:hypothetical protein
VTAELVTLLAGPSHIDVFGRDDHEPFVRLARAFSWSEARAVLNLLPSRRNLTLVAAGSPPPPSLLCTLAPHIDRLVLVPHRWLAALPRRRAWLRARRAARLATIHLANPIVTVTILSEDEVPF